MDEHKTTAENVQVEDTTSTSAPDVQETVVAQPETQESTETESVSADSRVAEPEAKPEGERKQTRAEKRLHDLLAKTKSVSAPQKGVPQGFPYDNAPPPLITKEDLENGIDPAVIEARQRQREQLIQAQTTQGAIAQMEQRFELKQTINTHLSDLEATKSALEQEKNEDLKDVIAEEYQMLNYVIDPQTGQEVFYPRVKMSDLYAKYKKILSTKVSAQVAENKVKMSDIASESAVLPRATDDVTAQEENDSQEFSRAQSSGKLSDWAAVLKKRGVARI